MTQPPASADQAGRPASRGRTPWRAIVIGCLLLPVNAFWLFQMEMATNQAGGSGGTAGPFPTTFSLFANAVCILLALVMLNGLVRRRFPRSALSQAELLIVYVMVNIGSCLLSVDFLDVLMPMLGHPTHYATASNGWQDLFVKHLPSWFYVHDNAALDGWYKGNSSIYVWSRFRAWIVPLAAWGAFIVVLISTMLCLNALVRKQWTRSEKLSYPVIQLPLDMTDPTGGFFSGRLLWAGFAAAGAISLLNGTALLVPSVPTLPVKVFDISPFVTARPWSGIGWTPVSFYPFAIGLSFLLPADLLFSCWFFYFVWKAERVASVYLGWSDYSQSYPYVNEQCFGGYAGIAALALWSVRRHLVEVLRGAWLGLTDDDPERPFSDRAAVIGALIGTLLLMAFFYAAGLSVWLCVAAVFIYLAIAVACTRMRAELGPPAHDLHNGGPDYILTAALGTRALHARELSILTYFYWFNRAYRSLAMPVQLEAFKMAERKSIPTRGVAIALTVALVVGLLSSYWAMLHITYMRGTEARMAPHLNGFGFEAFNRLDGWIRSPKDTDIPAMLAIGLGFVMTLVLQVVRMRFSSWPLHPLGLAVSGSYSMNTIWLPLIFAWICKVCLLRYGGMRAYRMALPFYLGLILGDYLFGCGWSLFGWAAGVNAYSFQQ